LAAYALDLQQGMFGSADANYTSKLVSAGFSATQAADFASTYTVVDQYTEPLTGFSITVFDKDGVKYLAVRGTEKPTASVTGFAAFLADAGTDISSGVRSSKVSPLLANHLARTLHLPPERLPA
jgi:hypothetical protein